MKKSLLSFAALLAGLSMSAQIYMAKTCEITFFSATPAENIEAINKAAKPLLNTATNDVQIKIAISAFVFEKPLMQEHFNENYMESDKIPYAFFKGKINEKIDYTKDGEYKVTVTGKLTIHGVDKDRTLDGTVTVKGNAIMLKTKFNVHIADHGIEVPTLVIKNIAEDVEVKLTAILEPFKK
jgi:hypothetical protein